MNKLKKKVTHTIKLYIRMYYSIIEINTKILILSF